MSLDGRSRRFNKSCLSGGLCKVPIRTGLDLDRKLSIKRLAVLKQNLSFLGFKNLGF